MLSGFHETQWDCWLLELGQGEGRGTASLESARRTVGPGEADAIRPEKTPPAVEQTYRPAW